MTERRRELEDLPDGLTHNPFAALRPEGPPDPTSAGEPATGAEPDGPPARDLRLSAERSGRAGKTVTRVVGADDELARELSRALGCGWSREEDDVLLQGDQVERAARWLGERGAERIDRG